MASERSAGLKRGLMLATAISAVLSGCASVEYDKVAANKAKPNVVAMPKSATETAYATPGSANAPATTARPAPGAVLGAVAMADKTAQPAATTTTAQAVPAPAAASSVGVAGQPVQVASANPLTSTDAKSGLELAYAAPALVAVPQPRPDIIAAANSLPMPTDAEEAQAAALNGATPVSSAEKDVQNLDQELASAQPTPGNPNPLLGDSVAVPTPRPGEQSIGLEAYANTPSMMAADGFDTSAPQEIEQEGGGLAPSSKLQSLIHKYAAFYKVPEALVHRVIKRESMYNPGAYSHGNYGLMQIRYNTARSLGYTGSPSGLFDAETNLKYAVKYLRGAFMVAENNHDNAVRLYARGYYFDAKRKGLLAAVQ